MTRVRKGNILLKLSDDKLQYSLQSYFERKYYNVFSVQNKREFEQLKKQNALMFAIFDDKGDINVNVAIANSLLNFDNQIVVYFICENDSSKQNIEQINSNFFTIVQPLVKRNFLAKMLSHSDELKEGEERTAIFNIGNYKFNVRSSSLQYKDKDTQLEFHLTRIEKQILEKLCLNIGKVVSRHRFLIDIWRKDDFQTSRSMDVYMTRLRKYLSYDTRICIENTHSVGYCLKINE